MLNVILVISKQASLNTITSARCQNWKMPTTSYIIGLNLRRVYVFLLSTKYQISNQLKVLASALLLHEATSLAQK